MLGKEARSIGPSSTSPPLRRNLPSLASQDAVNHQRKPGSRNAAPTSQVPRVIKGQIPGFGGEPMERHHRLMRMVSADGFPTSEEL